MIKKINLFLIAISIIGTIYFVITRDDSIINVLKDLSIIITINMLYILKKLLKIKLNEVIIFIYVLFIFIAHFLGVICELYNHIYWFDKFTHYMSGLVTSFGAIVILYKFKKQDNKWFNVIFIIAATLMVASLWEVFEYTSSCLFSVDPQKVVLTGVNDTMLDIIVAHLGSLLVSVCYIYETKYNRKLIISKFIELIS